MSCVLKLSGSRTPAGSEQIYWLDPHLPSETNPEPTGPTPLDLATTEARGIIAAANVEATEILEQARERGYQDGLEAATQQYAEGIDQLGNVIVGVQEEREAFFAGVEPQLVKLSVEIAEKILRHELETKPETVLEIVRLALLQIPARHSIALHISPEDAQLIKQRRDEISDPGGIRGIEIIEDRRVPRGGCIVESPSGNLDARIGSQLAEVTRVLMEATRDDEDSDTGPEQV